MCIAVRQRSCQRTHHICAAQRSTLVAFPLPLSLPATLAPPLSGQPSTTLPPLYHWLPFMRTKANKQQNICMLSQHMRRSLSRKASLPQCACASPASSACPPSRLRLLLRLKYFALLSRNYKSGQLLKICSRITKFARSNERELGIAPDSSGGSRQV